MRPELEKATDRYVPVGDDGGVNPLSRDDAEFVDALMDVVSKLSNNQELHRILESYKIDPDADVANNLREFEEGWDPLDQSKKFVIVGGKRLPVDLITSIEIVDSYDSEAQAPTWLIVINKTENQYEKLANTKISFSTPEERERALGELQEKLEDTGKVKFL